MMKRMAVALLKWCGILLLILFFFAGIAKVLTHARMNGSFDAKSIDKEMYIQVQDRTYYVNVRGVDRTAPLLLMLHGGPGYPMTPQLQLYQGALEDHYTVVNLDQWGCGKTALANAPYNLTMQDVITDLDGIVDQLCAALGQERVILFGFSYGTIVGMDYLQAYPDRVRGYVGLGQCVNYKAEVRSSMMKAAAVARLKHHEHDAQFLEKIVAVALARGHMMPRHFERAQQLMDKYLTYDNQMTPAKIFLVMSFSPYYALWDLWPYLPVGVDLQEPLQDYMIHEFNLTEREATFQIPMIFISGDQDWETPYPVVAAYAKTVDAPYTSFTLLPGVGHDALLEQSEPTVAAVLKELERAGLQSHETF